MIVNAELDNFHASFGGPSLFLRVQRKDPVGLPCKSLVFQVIPRLKNPRVNFTIRSIGIKVSLWLEGFLSLSDHNSRERRPRCQEAEIRQRTLPNVNPLLYPSSSTRPCYQNKTNPGGSTLYRPNDPLGAERVLQ